MKEKHALCLNKSVQVNIVNADRWVSAKSHTTYIHRMHAIFSIIWLPSAYTNTCGINACNMYALSHDGALLSLTQAYDITRRIFLKRVYGWISQNNEGGHHRVRFRNKYSFVLISHDDGTVVRQQNLCLHCTLQMSLLIQCHNYLLCQLLAPYGWPSI